MNLFDEQDLTKIEIIEASREVFKKFGYIKVSMEDIAKAANKSRSTLYNHFKNKKELFEAFVIRSFDALLKEAESRVDINASFEENLDAYYESRARSLFNLLGDYTSIIEDIKVHADFSHRFTCDRTEKESRIMAKMLRIALRKKEIANICESDLLFLSNLMVSVMRNFEEEIILNNKFDEIFERRAWLVSILAKGLK